MNTGDFEALLTGTYGCYVVKPSAVNWAQDSDFLTDTDMITILTKDRTGISNCVRKKGEGIGTTSFYFEGTTGNHYYKVVEQNTVSTGGKMGAIDMTQWFQQHETSRKFVKGFIVFGIGFLAANEASVLASLPSWAIVPLGALITAAASYIQTHSTLPIVGAKAKKK